MYATAKSNAKKTRRSAKRETRASMIAFYRAESRDWQTIGNNYHIAGDHDTARDCWRYARECLQFVWKLETMPLGDFYASLYAENLDFDPLEVC